MNNREQFLESLKAAGENAVREKFNLGGYGENRLLVQEFLRKFDESRQAESEARTLENTDKNIQIADSAKNAAWVAAVAALLALVISIFALLK